MDSSRQYIKMCRNAHEIQELHKPAIGDTWVCACSSCKNNPKPHVWTLSDYDVDSANPDYGLYQGDIHYFKSYAYLVTTQKDFGFGAFWKQKQEKIEWSYIWLPRQDQLQAMISTSDSFLLLEMFYQWAFDTVRDGSKDWVLFSMEQMWLTYVMKRNYGKIRKGEEWIIQQTT